MYIFLGNFSFIVNTRMYLSLETVVGRFKTLVNHDTYLTNSTYKKILPSLKGLCYNVIICSNLNNLKPYESTALSVKVLKAFRILVIETDPLLRTRQTFDDTAIGFRQNSTLTTYLVGTLLKDIQPDELARMNIINLSEANEDDFKNFLSKMSLVY